MMKENKEMKIQLQVFKTQSEIGSLSNIGGNAKSIMAEDISPRTQLNAPQHSRIRSLENSSIED